MFSYFLPRHIRQGRALLKDAKKLLAYKRDLWSETAVADFEAGIRNLEGAVKSGNKRAVEEAAEQLDGKAAACVKPVPDSGWRENCEVFLVAIVIALGVRTYFLQPFTIPTGSMQPTLNGIIGHPTTEPPPNLLVRIAHTVIFGRTWINLVATTEDAFVLREKKRFLFFTCTELQGNRSVYTANCPKDTLERYFLGPPRPYKAGEVIARGYYDTGDHVFVDKVSYHFRKPKRADVFVFNTQNVPTRENRNTGMEGPSQFYIKRLAGLPNDVLQIKPPELVINGARAQEQGFQKVMSGTYEEPNGGYAGYSNAAEQPGYGGGKRLHPMTYLRGPEEKFEVPPKQYYALGDNSYHSSDSRDWGGVPEQNLMGRGVFVYWPFGSHFGLIR